MKTRIIYSNNGTLSTIDSDVNNYYSGESSFTFVAAEDKLYIGNSLPFNHFYTKMGTTVNDTASVMTVKVWDGSSFTAVAELNDETSVSGKTFAQSGFVEFVPKKNSSWVRDDTVDSSGNQNITGLSSVEIYDKYWIEITFSADLTADVDIAWIGQLFSNDDDLQAEFPEFGFSDMKLAFESGKTDWQDQHYVAANIIAKDMVAMGNIWDRNQIMCREDLVLTSVQKVAQIIFNALGDDYLDQQTAAMKEYKERLKNAYAKVDTNSDGRIDVKEQRPIIGRFYR